MSTSSVTGTRPRDSRVVTVAISARRTSMADPVAAATVVVGLAPALAETICARAGATTFCGAAGGAGEGEVLLVMSIGVAAAACSSRSSAVLSSRESAATWIGAMSAIVHTLGAPSPLQDASLDCLDAEASSRGVCTPSQAISAHLGGSEHTKALWILF